MVLIVVDLPWPENKILHKSVKKSINFVQLFITYNSKVRMKKNYKGFT